MPYIHVTGIFYISKETWSFSQYIPTQVTDIDDLTLGEIRVRSTNHLNLYWSEGVEDIMNEVYGLEITKTELVEEAPEDLNRVEAYTIYNMAVGRKNAQHQEGYSVAVKSNIQEGSWKGGYKSG